MKCKCGRNISRHMLGQCMACRYKWRTQKPKGIKINPQRLPVPRLSPTRPVRIDTKEVYYTLSRSHGQGKGADDGRMDY